MELSQQSLHSFLYQPPCKLSHQGSYLSSFANATNAAAQACLFHNCWQTDMV